MVGEEINLDELAKQYVETEQAQQQAVAQDSTAPSQEQQAVQLEAQQQAEAQQPAQQTFLAQQTTSPTTLETEETEESQGKKDKEKIKKQYTSPMFLTPSTAYSSRLNNPFLTSSNNSYSMANPYGSMSAINPYENIYNNLYQASNQQQVQNTDPNKFVYNPKA